MAGRAGFIDAVRQLDYRGPMRLHFQLLLLGGLIGCAHKPPPAPPPPPPPPGDTLRLKHTPGDKPQSKVSLLIDQEQSGPPQKGGGARKIVLNFTFAEEESVEAVDPDGTAQISARLADAVGNADSGADAKMVDDFALALDELKISFRRSPRGEVAAITMSGVRKPLDESTARSILNSLYGATRGAILPEGPVHVNDTWKVPMQVSMPGGTIGDANYSYTYAKNEGGVATIVAEGTLETKGGADAKKRMTGKTTSEYHLDVAGGKMKATSVDVTTLIEDLSVAPTRSVRLRIKLDSTVQAPTTASR
jgi:hypothetical protein